MDVVDITDIQDYDQNIQYFKEDLDINVNLIRLKNFILNLKLINLRFYKFSKYYKNPKFGSPVAIVLHPHPQYGGTMNNRIVQLMYNIFLENGLLLRPLGNTIYLMPPYCIKEKTLYNCYEKIIEILT
mgnify:CR=1 FL=1